MNQKDFNPDFNDDDLLVDMTFKVVKIHIHNSCSIRGIHCIW